MRGESGKCLLTFTASLKDGIELAMHQYIGIPTDRGSEMGVERDRQSVVLIFCNIEHTGAEILSLCSRFSGQQLKDLPNTGVSNSFKGFHNGTRRSDVDLISEALRSFLESFLCDGSAHCTRAAE